MGKPELVVDGAAPEPAGRGAAARARDSLVNLALKVVFFAIFFFIVTPVGLFLRLLGVDHLGLRRPMERRSYWRLRSETKN